MSQTLVKLYNRLPDAAHHEVGADGQPVEVWARTGSGYARLTASSRSEASIVGVKRDGAISDVLEAEGWAPADVRTQDPGAEAAAWSDQFHRRWSRIFRYGITCSAGRIAPVRAFVRASQRDTLPSDWQERPAEDDNGGDHYLCTYTATLSQARALGAEQMALDGLGDLPGDITFAQAVAGVDGFSGIEKESRQPTVLPPQRYEPGDLFQTDVSALADRRGVTVTEEDVLEATGLALV